MGTAPVPGAAVAPSEEPGFDLFCSVKSTRGGGTVAMGGASVGGAEGVQPGVVPGMEGTGGVAEGGTVVLQHHTLESLYSGARWYRRGSSEGVPDGFHDRNVTDIIRNIPEGTEVVIEKYVNTSVVEGSHGSAIPATEAGD